MASERFAAGQSVALREVWDGRVFAARPAIVVADEPHGAMFYVPPVVTVLRAVGPDGQPWRLPYPGWQLQAFEWRHHRILSFAFPDTPYGVLARFDDATGAFDGWYLNLQDPLRRTAIGFDTTDHVLDVVIPADQLSWSWKDEDELVEALELGMISEASAAHIRWAGERAVEHVLLREPPFDEDWREWRPDRDGTRPSCRPRPPSRPREAEMAEVPSRLRPATAGDATRVRAESRSAGRSDPDLGARHHRDAGADAHRREDAARGRAVGSRGRDDPGAHRVAGSSPT